MKNSGSKEFLRSLLESSSPNRDLARREFVLNILLLGSFFLALIATLLAFINDMVAKIERGGDSVYFLASVCGFFLFCFFLSKKGRARIGSYLFLGFYFWVTSYLVFKQGTNVPQALLMYALIIVMSGILISSTFAFITTSLTTLLLILFTYMNGAGLIHFESHWRYNSVKIIDSVITSLTLFITALVSWLFNRESEKALKRARISEMILEKEKDSLADKVESKTKELRRSQEEKVIQLYRFAEFGKLASGFMHDLANSVNVVSMNLKQMEKNKDDASDMKKMVTRARVGTRHLENFVAAARKQINNQEHLEYFSINEEIKHAMDVLGYKAKENQVSMSFVSKKNIKTYGNSIKFYQLVFNLITNAIDAYDKSEQKYKSVKIETEQKDGFFYLKVTDFGVGIPAKNMPYIFEPFFTTKGFEKGTGIGLSISHGIATKDFGGKIEVTSEAISGTTFLVVFPKKVKV